MSQESFAQLDSAETAGDEVAPETTSQPSKPNGDSHVRTPSRRGRWVIVSLMLLAVAAAIGWGGYRWAFPPAGDSGPSDVDIVHNDTGSEVAPGESFVPKVEGGHPIDPALEIARKGLDHIRNDVRDYTARLVKRERIEGKLFDEETIQLKVRNRKQDGDELVVPFSVYMKFEKPAKAKDREVIWVEGENEGRLIAHEGSGPASYGRANLPPDHRFAMYGNRYPITHIGIENLVEQLIERGSREREHDIEVEFFDNVELKHREDAGSGRLCQQIVLRHTEKKPEYEFYLAHIFIDKEHFLPLRYAAYTWPEEEGGEPVLEEEYTYLDLKLNVGLTDHAFNWRNPDYNFPTFAFPLP